MFDKPVGEWRGYDPQWEDTQLNIVIGMVEAPAEQVAAAIPGIDDVELDVTDLLDQPPGFEIPRFAYHVWQLCDHAWSQVAPAVDEGYWFSSADYSRELKTRAWFDSWDTTVAAGGWDVHRDGRPVVGFSYDEFAGAHVPEHAKADLPPLPGELKSADGTWTFFSERDYGVDIKRAGEEDKRVKAEVLEELGFFVGCFSLFHTIENVMDTYGRENFRAALALTKKPRR